VKTLFHLYLNTKSKILLFCVLEYLIYTIIWKILQESEILLGGCLTVKNRVGRLWRVTDCEELVGGYSQEMMGLVLQELEIEPFL